MDTERGAAGAPAIDDQDLLVRIAARDATALRPFYLAYHRRLHRFLLRVTRDAQLADEAVNDTLLVVWQQAGAFRGESKISTWVLGIAYRRALKLLESQRRARASVESEQERRWCEEAEGLVDRLAESAERSDWLGHALAELSPEHRLAIELAYFVGLSCEEIAAVAGCPVGTVKTRLHHARLKLHDRLATLQAPQAAARTGAEG
ncbi:MAG: sigma-70 family RNA polymerase sigma factor [Steroidobacteraceae bacterium]